MSGYEELFSVGETFESFVARGLPAEIAAVNAAQAKLAQPGSISSETRHRLRSIGGQYHLLIAAEMWCPDCQLNLTAIDFLQRFATQVDLAIITRGRAENELKRRLELERVAIPLVLVLDAQWRLVGRFVEKPQAVIEAADAVKADYRAGNYLESTMKDILEIIAAADRQMNESSAALPV